MKKIYEAPVCIAAEMKAEAMIAQSLTVGGEAGDTDNPIECDTKENKGSLWGEEW